MLAAAEGSLTVAVAPEVLAPALPEFAAAAAAAVVTAATAAIVVEAAATEAGGAIAEAGAAGAGAILFLHSGKAIAKSWSYRQSSSD